MPYSLSSSKEDSSVVESPVLLHGTGFIPGKRMVKIEVCVYSQAEPKKRGIKTQFSEEKANF